MTTPELRSKLHSLSYDEDDTDSSQSLESENETDDTLEYEEGDGIRSVLSNKFTPFNMKEELENGYFDSEGTYHWKKSKIKDYWLDNIDSSSLENGYQQLNNISEINKSDPIDEWDSLDTYKKILCYLQPKETIAQALCRLGRDNALTTIKRWKLKKLGTLTDSGNAQKVTDLTGLANDILTRTGDFDIYQNTYEGISEKINILKRGFVKDDITPPLQDITPELDMFSDEFIEKEKVIFKEKYIK